MRKFVTGYQFVPIAESHSSGIHVCPHCRRRDFIYHWEVVDAGLYNNPDHWNNTVAPGTWKRGGIGEKGRYCFVTRYRCNNVTTCQKCHHTFNDPNHSISTCHQDVHESLRWDWHCFAKYRDIITLLNRRPGSNFQIPS